MRIVAYTLMMSGLLLLVDAGRDELRGVAAASTPRSSTINVARRVEDPKGFRNLMYYQWVRGPVVICAGLIILGLCRRADRLDAFSPDFAGNSALDDLN